MRIILLVIAILLLAPPLWAQPQLSEQLVKSMLQGPKGKVVLKMRLTPVKGGHHGTPVTMEVNQQRLAGKRIVQWQLVGQGGRHDYCLSCSSKGLIQGCDKGQRPDPDGKIPGIGQPWRLMTEQLCKVSVKRQEDQMHPSGVKVAVFDIKPEGYGKQRAFSRTYFSQRSGLPFKVVHYDELGNMSALIQVIRAGKMPWGPAISMARYIFQPGVDELLFEITGGHTVDDTHRFIDTH